MVSRKILIVLDKSHLLSLRSKYHVCAFSKTKEVLEWRDVGDPLPRKAIPVAFQEKGGNWIPIVDTDAFLATEAIKIYNRKFSL